MSKLLVLLGCATPLFASEPANIQAWLKEADAFRLTADSERVDTEVRFFKGNRLDKTRRYEVYAQSGRRSLVVFRSPSERGQKMLMLGDDFWLVLPSSQRPLRITPTQKLLGDASNGDIATLTWAEDYDGRTVGESMVNGVPCVRLDLAGQRKGVSYARIVLALATSDHHPVAAELYVASNKLAKEAVFEMGELAGRSQVTAMILTDHIQHERRTEIRYLARAPKLLGPEFYNPAFLVHASVEP